MIEKDLDLYSALFLFEEEKKPFLKRNTSIAFVIWQTIKAVFTTYERCIPPIRLLCKSIEDFILTGIHLRIHSLELILDPFVIILIY